MMLAQLPAMPLIKIALLYLACPLLAACSTPPATITRGETQSTQMSPTDLAQSDSNRMATLGIQDNLASLLLLADKLYRRNPTEWHKSNTSREAALA